MNQKTLVDALTQLTGGWTPADGTSSADLDAARAAVAESLSAQPIEAVHAAHRLPSLPLVRDAVSRGGADLAGALDSLAARVLEPGSPAPRNRVFVRSVPARVESNPAAVPEWARGMKASKTYGPFQAADGSKAWIDVYPLLVHVAVARQPQGTAFLLVEASAAAPKAGKAVHLGAGSVWIASKAIAGGAPAGGWTGIAIQSGTLTIDADTTLVNGVVQIPAGATLTLAIVPAPAADPAPTQGIGADATHAVSKVPASATFTFAPAKCTVSAGVASLAAYGTKVDLKQDPTRAPTFSAPLQEILIPFDPSTPSFGVTTVVTKLFIPGGHAVIESGAWGLPVAVAAPDTLGAAAGAGTVVLATKPGLACTWQGLQHARVPLGAALIQVAPGQLLFLGQARPRRASQIFKLWAEAAAGRSSTGEMAYSEPAPIAFFAQQDVELLVTSGTAAAHLDRPLLADGGRVPFRSSAAALAIATLKTGQLVQIVATAPLPKQAPCFPMALENAFVETSPPVLFTLFGKLESGAVTAGFANLLFELHDIVPTLPDPYAASFSIHREGRLVAIGTAAAQVVWPDPAKAKLAFSFAFTDSALGAAPAGAPASPADVRPAGAAAPFPDSVSDRGGFRLLDVSTNADLFGVAVSSANPRGVLQTSGLTLEVPSRNLRLMTVPGISWEPVRSIDPPDPVPDPFVFDDDGFPTQVAVNSVHLVPMAPRPAYDDILQSIAAGATGEALFTLPFGMSAQVRLGDSKQPGTPIANVGEVRPAFAKPALQGGMQLSLTAGPALHAYEDAVMPGRALQAPPPPASATPPPPATTVLGNDVEAIFNADFYSGTAGGVQTPRVPLTRYDISGYGASTFSDWRHDPDLAGVTPPQTEVTAIVKAQFQVLVGRTAYEVVQARSILYPFGVKVVRTITLFRDGGGGMYRRDSGWIASSPGVYEYGGLDVHPGAVEGVFNVKNIADTGEQYTDPSQNITLAAVLYDCDVKLRNVANGGAASGLVPSKGQFGYVQLNPSLELTPAQLKQVIQKKGALGGPVSATVHVAGSAQRLRATRVDVGIAPPDGGGAPEFAAAVRGTPILPKEGSWTVGRKAGATHAAAPLPKGTTVPVIRRGRAKGPAPAASEPWKFADPADLLAASPVSDYGFLQGTGTQAMFVQRPEIDEVKKAIVPPVPSSLADVSALLKTAGVFPPDIANFHLPSGFQLDPSPDGLTFAGAGAKYQIHVPAGTTNRLLDLDFVKVTLDFSDLKGTSTTITLELKPGRWSVVIAPLTFVLDLGPFDQILAVTGMFSGADGAAPSFTGLPKDPANPFGARDQPSIVYGDALGVLTDLLTALKDLLKGLGLPVEMDVSFAGNTLTVRDSLPIPDLPLGLGTISGITLDLGVDLTLPDKVHFVAGISSPEAPFKWVIFPLAGNGCVQIAAKDNQSDIVVQGGLGLGIAIDVGVAKGSASIVLSVELDIGSAAVSIKGTLTGNAEVDVLGGLVSASLTLSAGLGIQIPTSGPQDHVDVFADVSVGIHISICWVIDIDFDGSWQFSRELSR